MSKSGCFNYCQDEQSFCEQEASILIVQTWLHTVSEQTELLNPYFIKAEFMVLVPEIRCCYNLGR
jgi:hypothetical protein